MLFFMAMPGGHKGEHTDLEFLITIGNQKLETNIISRYKKRLIIKPFILGLYDTT